MYSLAELDEMISLNKKIRDITIKQLHLINFLKTTYPNIKQIDFEEDSPTIEFEEKIEKKILSLIDSELNCLNTIRTEINEDSTDILKLEELVEDFKRIRRERIEFIGS